jgi:cell division septation protein DedD
MAKTAKDLYDNGKQIAQTDWSNPKQALAAIAGTANVAGMDGIAKATELASKVRDAIKADWKDPKAALAAATNIMKGTGLNKMVAALASDLVTTKDSSGASNPLPANFPKPGAPQSNSNGSSPSRNSAPKATNGMIPESPEGNPRLPITSDVLAEMKEKNPLAYRRVIDIQERTGSIPPNAFVEVTKPAKDKNGNPIPDSERTAVYVPGEGFSTTPNERASSSLWSVPDGIREVFVAGSGPSVGEFFGIKQKEGNWYLFGGLIDLGSPEMPGAGAGGNAWWVPDKIFGMDFSKYYDYHDKHYYGNDVRLSDMGKILGVEANAFWEGLGSNPLQWPFQALYSGATTTVGTLTALDNSLKDILGKGDFSSLKDFFGNVFGENPLSPNDLGASKIVAGGCVGPEVPTLPGQSAPGTGSGAPGQGVPPAKGKAGAPDGNALGAGQDGVLITTAQGNPAAAAAAIEAAFRKDNQESLNKAQAEERAKQEKAAQEKAAKEKAAQEKAEQEKETPPGAAGNGQGKAPTEGPTATPTPHPEPKPTPDPKATNPDGTYPSPSPTPQPQPAPTPSPTDKEANNEEGPSPPDRPNDGGFGDAAEKAANETQKNEQGALDDAHRQAQAEADSAKQQAQQKANDLQKNANDLKADADAANHSQQNSAADHHDAIKANEKAANAQFDANDAKKTADALPSGSDIPKTTGASALSEYAQKAGKIGLVGDVVQGGVGAYDAYNLHQAGQNRDATAKLGETAGSLAGGVAGAAKGAAIGFGLGGPVGAGVGGLVGALLGDKAGGALGGAAGGLAADVAGIENKQHIASNSTQSSPTNSSTPDPVPTVPSQPDPTPTPPPS